MISHDSRVILVTFLFPQMYLKIVTLKKMTKVVFLRMIQKLSQNEPLQHASLGRTINQFYDYSLFSIVKSPYLRAYEIWKRGQSNLKKKKWESYT